MGLYSNRQIYNEAREVRAEVMRTDEYLFDKNKGKSKKKKKREREMRGMSFEKILEVWELKNEFFK